MLKEFGTTKETELGFELVNGAIRPLAEAKRFDGSRFENLQRNEFRADLFAITVPVTYLQGTHDPMTPAPGAVAHFKEAAVGPKQLIFFRGLGHMPFEALIAQARDESPEDLA